MPGFFHSYVLVSKLPILEKVQMGIFIIKLHQARASREHTRNLFYRRVPSTKYLILRNFAILSADAPIQEAAIWFG